MNVHNSGGCGFSYDGISHQQKQDSDGFWGAWKLVAQCWWQWWGTILCTYFQKKSNAKLSYMFFVACVYLWLLTYNSKEYAASNSRVYVRLNDPWTRLSLRAGPTLFKLLSTFSSRQPTFQDVVHTIHTLDKVSKIQMANWKKYSCKLERNTVDSSKTPSSKSQSRRPCQETLSATPRICRGNGNWGFLR